MPREMTTKTRKIKEGGVGQNHPMLARRAWAIKMKVFMQAHAVWKAIEAKDPEITVKERPIR